MRLLERRRTMKREKRNKLERAGWRVGSAEEFLGLSEDEQAIVELKVALADAVKVQREKRDYRKAPWQDE
jgi:hypothetical protein